MVDQEIESWAAFWQSVERLGASLRKSRAINVNSDAVREEARALVQRYFRKFRPGLVTLGFNAQHLTPLDEASQKLLRLANGRNQATSYRNALRAFRNQRPAIES